MKLDASTTLVIERDDIEMERVDVSVPEWKKLASVDEPSHRGVDHSNSEAIQDHVEGCYKHSLLAHLEFACTGDFLSAHDAFVMFVEPFINIGVPVYRRAGCPRLLCREEESYQTWEAWPYMALVRSGGTLSIDRVRFEPGLKCIEIKVGPTGQEGADFALVGAPILDEGKVLPIAEVAAFCYDPRHVWQLVFERWQEKRWPSAVERDRPVHARLMASFLKNLTSPSQHRGQLLAEIADGAKLKLARYFRLSVGINSRTDGLSIVLGHATVSEAAALQQSLGADRAILLGHGGNAAIGYHATRLQREGGAKRCVTCFASSTYSRSTHAALVIPLRESCQLIENVFVG